jgi:hypothetical protein
MKAILMKKLFGSLFIAVQEMPYRYYTHSSLLTPIFKLCTLFTTKEYPSPPGRVGGRLAEREVEVIGWKPPQQAAIERRSD